MTGLKKSRTESVETFLYDAAGEQLCRRVKTRSGEIRESSLPCPDGIVKKSHVDLGKIYDRLWLRTEQPPEWTIQGDPIVVADLFSGAGLMTLGAAEAARALERPYRIRFAIEVDPKSMSVFRRNFPQASTFVTAVEDVFAEGSTVIQSSLDEEFLKPHEVSLMLAGPPCKGSSDLNNHTRRNDPRNRLFFCVARAAERLLPAHIIVENVPGIQHDASEVVTETREALEELNYKVDVQVVKCEELGVPQTRHRLILVASRSRSVSISSMVSKHRCAERSMAWACDDLVDRVSDDLIDTPSNLSQQSVRRINYLFERDLFELPNEMRPPCHRENNHSYKSVYGRLNWSKPAQTITTGFGSMGQGRFVHPSRHRTITPHEAARLQFIPDFFDLTTDTRTALYEIVGNAVPPKLTYVLALELLR